MADRVVVVTGAGHGLGRAYALEFARSGADVVVNDPGTAADGRPSAEAVAEEVRALGARAVASLDPVGTGEATEAIVRTAVEAFGRVDAVVNNAGIVYGTDFDSVTVQQLDDMHRVHVTGGILLAQACYSQMKERGFGRIVMTSSNSTFGLGGMLAYAAAKGSIISATKAIATEIEGSGVLINAIFPSANTNPGRTKGIGDTPRLLGSLAQRHDADHVAPLVNYLSSSACQSNGHLYSAVAGRYARVFLGVSRGWSAEGSATATQEQIHAHWAEIESRDGYIAPDHVLDEIGAVGQAWGGTAG